MSKLTSAQLQIIIEQLKDDDHFDLSVQLESHIAALEAENKAFHDALTSIYHGARNFTDMKIAHGALCKNEVSPRGIECEECRNKRYENSKEESDNQ